MLILSAFRALNIELDYIPEGLVADDDNLSIHASAMMDAVDVRDWFRERVIALDSEWDCWHPDEARDENANTFLKNIEAFGVQGYTVWDIQLKPEANMRVNLFVPRAGGKSVIISGRGDFLITKARNALGRRVSVVDYLENILGVVEIQSNDSIARCEHQLLAYLFILMNIKGLSSLIGFLVYKDGSCRAFKASRGGTGCIYEQNDLFHVSDIAQVFHNLVL